jgi:hypothetical protein
MTKKIDVVNGTYKLIRISGLTSQAVPEETETALQVADDYAGELLSTGLDIGWVQPLDYGQSDPDDYSGLNAQTMGPFKKLLAIELVDYFGKQAPPTLHSNADKGMRSLEQLLVNVNPAQNPGTLPIGSGNEWDYRSDKFYPEPISDDGAIYKNTSNVFQLPIDWSAFLAGLYTLTSVVYEADTGIVLTNESITDEISVVTVSFSRQGQFSLCVKATNSNGDVDSYKTIYNVTDCNKNYYP